MIECVGKLKSVFSFVVLLCLCIQCGEGAAMKGQNGGTFNKNSKPKSSPGESKHMKDVARQVLKVLQKLAGNKVEAEKFDQQLGDELKRVGVSYRSDGRLLGHCENRHQSNEYVPNALSTAQNENGFTDQVPDVFSYILEAAQSVDIEAVDWDMDVWADKRGQLYQIAIPLPEDFVKTHWVLTPTNDHVRFTEKLKGGYDALLIKKLTELKKKLDSAQGRAIVFSGEGFCVADEPYVQIFSGIPKENRNEFCRLLKECETVLESVLKNNPELRGSSISLISSSMLTNSELEKITVLSKKKDENEEVEYLSDKLSKASGRKLETEELTLTDLRLLRDLWNSCVSKAKSLPQPTMPLEILPKIKAGLEESLAKNLLSDTYSQFPADNWDVFLTKDEVSEFIKIIKKISTDPKIINSSIAKLVRSFSLGLYDKLHLILSKVLEKNKRDALILFKWYRYGDFKPSEFPGRWKLLYPNSICLQFSGAKLTSIYFQVWGSESKPCLCAQCTTDKSSLKVMMYGHLGNASSLLLSPNASLRDRRLPNLPSSKAPEETEMDRAIRESATEFHTPLRGTCLDTIGIREFCDRINATGFQEDTGYEVQIDGSNSELVRVYHEPRTNTPLVRIRTGGINNMCPLLTLGSLSRAGSNIEDIVVAIAKRLRARAIEWLSNHSSTPITDEQALNNLLASISGDLVHVSVGELRWGLMSEQEVSELVDSQVGELIPNGIIDYAALWRFLNRDESQIWVDDAIWWNAMADALDSTIVIYQGDTDGRLKEVVRYGGNTANVVRIFWRRGHYSALVPPNEGRVRHVIDLNGKYNPMF